MNGRVIFLIILTISYLFSKAFASSVHQENIESILENINVIELELNKLKAALSSIDNKALTANAITDSNNLSEDKKEYELALGALKDQKYTQAEQKFSDFITRFPKSSLQSNAHFWYAESFYRRGMFDKAAIYYLKGYKQFPKDAKSSDSLLKLALSLGALNKLEDACKVLSKLETEFPKRSGSSIKRAKDASIKFGCNF